jgi:acetyl-CoA carboxylase biotin carboxyl carrier protein
MSAKSVTPKKASGPVLAQREKKSTKNGVSDDDRLLDKLRSIVRILEESSLAELKYEDGDLIVALSRHAAGPISVTQLPMQAVPSLAPAPASMASAPAILTAPSPATTALPAVESKGGKAEEADVHVVRSPFIGTFYRSPTPEADPFVEVGQPVRRGQTLCIVEAMKLMNEIESEVDGVVLEIFVDNGRTVQYGDALFKIRTKG